MARDGSVNVLLVGGILAACALASCTSGSDKMAPPPPPPPPPMAAPPPPPPPAARMMPEMVVVRGSANALAWYPVGRRVPVDARICLPAAARYVTFQRTDGGTVTYGGGGCNKVIAEPPPSEGRAGAGSGP